MQTFSLTFVSLYKFRKTYEAKPDFSYDMRWLLQN